MNKYELAIAIKDMVKENGHEVKIIEDTDAKTVLEVEIAHEWDKKTIKVTVE